MESSSRVRNGAEDFGLGLPVERRVRIVNISRIPQSVGFADFDPGETREVTPEQAAYLLALPYFRREEDAPPELTARGRALAASGCTPGPPGFVRQFRHALWPDPTPEDWVRGLNDSCFPCRTREFDSVIATHRPKTICFRSPGLTELNGGTRVILRLAGHLARRGHRVTVSAADSHVRPEDVADIPITLHVGRSVPDADFVVGTYWTTLLEVANAPISGRRVGLLQGDEPAWPTQPYPDRAAKAFALPGLYYIAICPTLAHTCRAKYGTRRVDYLPGNGVDTLDFSPRINSFERRNRLCFLYRDVYWKGDLECVTAARLMQEAIPNFGAGAAGFTRWSHPGVDYTTRPDVEQMALLYSSADFYLSFSRFEGSPLPPLEAMACGCIPIVTAIGVEDYLRHGENGLLVEAYNPRGAVALMLSVLEDDDWRRQMMQEGLRTARERSWRVVCESFEELLLSA